VTEPLTGFKVLEIGGPPGAFAGMMLADHGADLLKIRQSGSVRSVGGGRGHSVDPLGRGRRSIDLDLRHPRGAEAFLRLVEDADALIEGFRPGVMEHRGVGPAQCLARSPHLVYGRMTGWGQDGPWAHRAGHDVNYLALSGTLDAIGERGGPPIIPLNLVGDWAGGLLMAFGIVSALHQAARTGAGVVIDASMLDVAALLASIPNAMWSRGNWRPGRAANMVDGGHPYYSIYRTADDRYIAVGAIEPQFYAELIEHLGLADAGLPDQLDESGWDEVRSAIEGAFATRTLEDWCVVMDGTDACVAPVLGFGEARRHPHNVSRGVFVDHGGVVQPAPAPRFDGRVSQIRSWEDCNVSTKVALVEWGLEADEVAELVGSGAIG
jgi:alpha-methylacyl-CoA racemase